MKDKFAKMVLQVGQYIVKTITAQIVDYLASEEFDKKVKGYITTIVAHLVQLVTSEKKVSA